MELPKVEEKVGLYRFHWESEKINVLVSNIKNSDDAPTAELVIRTTSDMANPHLLQTRLNLLSTQTKTTLAKKLTEKYKVLEVAWDDLIEQVSVLTLRKIRQGIPPKHIIGGTEITEKSHMLYPIIPKGEPTIIYGLGGVGKSFIALNAAQIVKNNWIDNPCELVPPEKPANVGYLDWETGEDAFQRRVNKVMAGHAQERFDIDYLSMYRPVPEDLERIQNFLLDNEIEFIILDSAAGACGGDLNSAEPVIRMYNALRQLNVTSLILAHTSKAGGGKENTVYGSVFFFNYARSVWEQKKSEVQAEREMNIELHHRKCNDDELHDRLALNLVFSKDAVTIMKGEDTPKTSQQKDSHRARVYNALRTHGKLTTERISEITGIVHGSVRVAVHRLKTDGKIEKDDINRWFLLVPDYSNVTESYR